jgi:hypothetical protein
MFRAKTSRGRNSATFAAQVLRQKGFSILRCSTESKSAGLICKAHEKSREAGRVKLIGLDESRDILEVDQTSLI